MAHVRISPREVTPWLGHLAIYTKVFIGHELDERMLSLMDEEGPPPPATFGVPEW